MLTAGVLVASILFLSQANPDVKKAEGTAMVVVANDTKSIRAESLMHHGARAAKEDALNSGAENDLNQTPNGRTLYAFRLNPGERLALTLQAKASGQMFMGFVPPAVTDAMKEEYHLANSTPRPVREKSIKIRNIQDSPADVVLALYGPVNVPFELKIERQ